MRRRIARALRAVATIALPPLALLAAACGGSRERPAAAPRATAPPAPLPPAVLALPITIQTSAIVAPLDRALPRADSLGRAECLALGGMVCHQYVYRRDTTELRATGDRIDLVARLRYRGRVALPTGGSVFRLTSALVSPIFSVVPSTEISFPVTLSIQLA